MNKKQFEHIENKIREAADNFQPPFTEDAWLMMNQLLDDEVASKPKRGGLWLSSLLLLLLVGSGIGFYYYYNNEGKIADPAKQEQLSSKGVAIKPEAAPESAASSKELSSNKKDEKQDATAEKQAGIVKSENAVEVHSKQRPVSKPANQQPVAKLNIKSRMTEWMRCGNL